MSTNFTLYLLDQISDYSAFESVCHDLMALTGYKGIEPLGGFTDKGRDAVHVSRSGQTTIFAYSVREDWRAKLAEDAGKIARHGHTCDQLVFATTSEISASERDEAVKAIQEQYKWPLDLYSRERLRVLLDAEHPQVKASHPSIFPTEFLALERQVKQAEGRDHIFVSYSASDAMLAEWLARKLTAEGYLVWCRRFEQLSGDKYPNDEDAAIQRRSARVVAFYSEQALQDPDLVRQRAIALGISKSDIPGFLIPIRTETLPVDQLDRATRELVFIPFSESWASGLQALLAKLERYGCPRLAKTGMTVAASAFLGQDVISTNVEALPTNCLPIQRIPDTIHRFSLPKSVGWSEIEQLAKTWAFRRTGDGQLLSFHQPPRDAAKTYPIRARGRVQWRGMDRVDGIFTKNLVSELLRKALLVLCGQRGLQHCDSTHLYYFPLGLVAGDKLRYTLMDGTTNFVTVAGERKYRRSANNERYRYYLAPDFYISQTLGEDFTALLRVRVRISDTEGTVPSARSANARRKDLCHDWWNHEWLTRMMAICQYLGNNSDLVIGQRQADRIVVGAAPQIVLAPVGINEANLDRTSFERDDTLLDFEEDEEEE